MLNLNNLPLFLMEENIPLMILLAVGGIILALLAVVLFDKLINFLQSRIPFVPALISIGLAIWAHFYITNENTYGIEAIGIYFGILYFSCYFALPIFEDAYDGPSINIVSGLVSNIIEIDDSPTAAIIVKIVVCAIFAGILFVIGGLMQYTIAAMVIQIITAVICCIICCFTVYDY